MGGRAWRGWYRFLAERDWTPECHDYEAPYAIDIGARRLVVLDSTHADDREAKPHQVMHYQALLETELDEVPVGTKNRAEDASSRVDGSGFVDGATPPPGAHAGEGKTPEERSKERATTRARFRGMIEKHGIRHGAAGGLLGDSPPFRILMDARTDAPLPPALTLEVDDPVAVTGGYRLDAVFGLSAVPATEEAVRACKGYLLFYVAKRFS